jgi:hypothetical protein
VSQLLWSFKMAFFWRYIVPVVVSSFPAIPLFLSYL